MPRSQRPLWVAEQLEVALFEGLAYRCQARRKYPVRTDAEALMGDLALVITNIDVQSGRIKLHGELWSARAFDETQVLEPGRAVTVMHIAGPTAVV